MLNEGGLFGEREGWHLPGFDTSSWESRPLSAGLPGSKAGVGFFITKFTLDVPSGTDIPMSFVFEDNSENYRALLFVNGWNYGKVCMCCIELLSTFDAISGRPCSSAWVTWAPK